MSKTPLKPRINPKTDFSLNCSKPMRTLPRNTMIGEVAVRTEARLLLMCFSAMVVIPLAMIIINVERMI